MNLLPPELEKHLRNELQPGEHPVWHGQPQRLWPLAIRESWHIALSALIPGFFGMFWIRSLKENFAGSTPLNPMLTLFTWAGYLMMGGAAALLLSPLWHVRKAAKTIYAVTPRRAIIITPKLGGGNTVYSLTPEMLDNMIRSTHPDGTGNLVFTEIIRHSRTNVITLGFFGIPDVQHVEKIIRNMRGENFRA